MLSEQIEVTTTPTSIRQLIATARGVGIDDIPNNGSGIQLRYGSLETELITLTDPDHGGGSVTGAIVLDARNEGVTNCNLEQSTIHSSFLNCDSGTVIVHVIIPRIF